MGKLRGWAPDLRVGVTERMVRAKRMLLDDVRKNAVYDVPSARPKDISVRQVPHLEAPEPSP